MKNYWHQRKKKGSQLGKSAIGKRKDCIHPSQKEALKKPYQLRRRSRKVAWRNAREGANGFGWDGRQAPVDKTITNNYETRIKTTRGERYSYRDKKKV